MSVKIDYKVEGLEQLDRAIRELRDEMKGDEGNIIASSLMSASLPVLRDAQARVPVKSGKLRRSIKRKRVTNPRAYSEAITVGVPLPRWQKGKHARLEDSTDALYGAFVELGTKRMAKHPFLRPALEGKAQEAIERFKQVAGQKIEKAGQKIGRKRGA